MNWEQARRVIVSRNKKWWDHKQHRDKSSDPNWAEYQCAKQSYNLALDQAKSLYYNDKIVEAGPDSREVFSIVKSLLHEDGESTIPSHFSAWISWSLCSIQNSSPCTNLLHVPISNIGKGDRAFMIAGPKVWNSLPSNIRTITNLVDFKKKLKTFFYRKAFM